MKTSDRQNNFNRKKRFGVYSLLGLFSAVALFSGCTKRPTERECIASLNNYLTLSSKNSPILKKFQEQGQEQIKSMAALCTKKRKKSVVLCEIKAKNLAEFKKCRNKK